MKTDCQTKNGSDTVRWLKSIFCTSTDDLQAAIECSAAEPTEQLTQSPRKGKTVLVVDDDPVFLKAASMRLESEGFDVIVAAEGSEAIQIARHNRPDVLVLDVELTRDVAGVPWDGFSLISWLRRFEEFKNIPVVIATGGDAAKLTNKAFSSGASAFFHKRMEPQVLVSLINRSLKKPRLANSGLSSSFQI